ncbi:lytic transglycosylase domain-containing protein [Sphingobium sp. H39-3-25]|uniref:lytic transglycosylase domain-containing protein n=1 Tax=Sphingobium arseniciresistens TaxID=3030834 RepID=UPI0023B970D6|nr:lytic transglycosylase domain-containing protein [Sphingobium arseniciresistens]
MRVFLLGVAAASLVCSTQTQAAPNTAQPARSVQLIAMGAPEKPDRAAPAQAGDHAITGTPPAIADFKVHDLSRRWVEFEMANSFADEKSAPQPPQDEDPFAHLGVAQPGVVPAQMAPSPTSAIPVPIWMRGGPVFALAAYSYVPGCYTSGYRPTGFLASDAEIRRANYYGMMSNIACQYGVPVGLFDAMIIRESRYRPDAFSPKSAFGLTQLMPGTAIALGVNRYSVEENLRGGAKYLRQQLDRFGHYHLALAAYNAGPGRVRNGLVPQIAETQAYVENVLLTWSRLSGVNRQATIVSRVREAPARADPRAFGRTAAVSTF